jgi:hypothetical protein
LEAVAHQPNGGESVAPQTDETGREGVGEALGDRLGASRHRDVEVLVGRVGQPVADYAPDQVTGRAAGGGAKGAHHGLA